MEHLSDTIQELIKKSHEAKKNAFCPYSNFRVGAALLTDDGTIIQGCNVENASYTLGICAERCAIFKAVSEGYRHFKAIAISTDVEKLYATPCGACRQIMYEYDEDLTTHSQFGSDMDVYMTRPDDTFMLKTPRDILCHAFGPEELRMMKVGENPGVNGDLNDNMVKVDGTDDTPPCKKHKGDTAVPAQ